MPKLVRILLTPLLCGLMAALVGSGLSGCGGETAKDFQGGLQESAKSAAEGKAKLKADKTKGPRGKGMADDDTF